MRAIATGGRCGTRGLLALAAALLSPAAAPAGLPLFTHGDPTPHEQLALELLNRARAAPVAEAARFGIPLNQGLPAGTLGREPLPPLAFNRQILAAARGHSRWMLDTNTFDHRGAGGSYEVDRLRAAGFPFAGSFTYGENLAWQGHSGALQVEQAVRQAYDGLFRSPDHRTNILYPQYDEVGIGIETGLFRSGGRTFNAAMMTQDFAASSASPLAGESDGPYLLGVVYFDLNLNGFYDPGEEIPGVEIVPEPGRFRAVSSTSGGYAIPMAGIAGAVRVLARGGPFDGESRDIRMPATHNLKLDFTDADTTDSDNDGWADPWDLLPHPLPLFRVGQQVEFFLRPLAGGSDAFAAANLPPGLSLDPATGRVSGRPLRPGTTTARARARRGSTWLPWQEIEIQVAALPAWLTGSFSGTIARQPGLDGGHGGRFGLTIGASGICTGFVANASQRFSFRGRIEPAADGSATLAATIARRGQPGRLLALEFGTDGRLAGSWDDGSAGAAADGWQQIWKPRTRPLPADATGSFTAVWLREDDQDGPDGHGYFSWTARPGGTATLTGKLPDGTSVLWSGVAAPDASWAVWLPLRRGSASLAGNLFVQGDVSDGLGGAWSWWKGADPRSRSFSLGFGSPQEPLELSARGGRYLPPPKGAGAAWLGLPAGSPNSALVFSGAALPAGQATTSLAMTVTPTLRVILAPGSPLARRFQLNARTGRFSGDFAFATPAADGRMVWAPAKCEGVLLPALAGSGLPSGAGFFLRSQPGAAETLSGGVELHPGPEL
jgi:hypothetical protein